MNEDNAQAGEKNVVIYTTPTCHFCKMTKDFFTEHNVEYAEHDVSTDEEKRKEMIEKSGQMGVPVVFIGSEMVIGFDKDKFTQMLGL